MPTKMDDIHNDYVFGRLSESSSKSSELLDGLSVTLDPNTIRHLTQLGVSPGWSCLEVGGGSGTVAKWLSAAVRSNGNVLVTDIDTRFIETRISESQLNNMKVIRHDITREDLPEGKFDLVHERLVLVHLPQRDQVFRKMVAALRPGGHILIEAFDPTALGDDYSIGPPESVKLYAKLAKARLTVMKIHGADDPFYGRKQIDLLHSGGLAEIGMEGYTTIWRGGSPSSLIDKSTFARIRDEAIISGLLSSKEFEEGMKVFDDPNWGRIAPLLISAWGTKRIE